MNCPFKVLTTINHSLTRAELGPGTSPLVSGVSDSLRFKSSENSWVTGVGGSCGVKTEEGPGSDCAKLSLGSSSVMSSQDYRGTRKQFLDSCDTVMLYMYVCIQYILLSLTLSMSLGSRCSFSRSSLMWRLERKTRWASWLICRCWLSLSVSEITSLKEKKLKLKRKC